MLRLGRFACEEIGEGLAIADRLSNDVTLLNPGAALVWLLLSECASRPSDLAARAAPLWSGAPPDRLAEDCAALLQDWHGKGWCSPLPDGRWHMTITCPPLDEQQAPPGPALPHLVLWSRRIALSGSAFTLEIAGAPGVAESAEFHRRTGFFQGLPQTAEIEPQRTVSLIFDEARVIVSDDGRLTAFPDAVAASPFLQLCCLRAAYPGTGALAMLHAAAVSRATGTILLPAVSGSGKTTLTAHLVARGWGYGGDDIVGLDRNAVTGRIGLLPFPSALGVKDGAAALLSTDYPELASLAPVAYGRKTARYIALPQGCITPDAGDWRRPGALVFPAYAPNASAELVPVGEWEALALLLEAGTGIGMGIDPDSFALLLDIVKTLPRYHLRYADLADAERLLENVT